MCARAMSASLGDAGVMGEVGYGRNWRCRDAWSERRVPMMRSPRRGFLACCTPRSPHIVHFTQSPTFTPPHALPEHCRGQGGPGGHRPRWARPVARPGRGPGASSQSRKCAESGRPGHRGARGRHSAHCCSTHGLNVIEPLHQHIVLDPDRGLGAADCKISSTCHPPINANEHLERPMSDTMSQGGMIRGARHEGHQCRRCRAEHG